MAAAPLVILLPRESAQQSHALGGRHTRQPVKGQPATVQFAVGGESADAVHAAVLDAEEDENVARALKLNGSLTTRNHHAGSCAFERTPAAASVSAAILERAVAAHLVLAGYGANGIAYPRRTRLRRRDRLELAIESRSHRPRIGLCVGDPRL